MYKGRFLQGSAPSKKTAPAQEAPAPKTKKRASKGTVIFYSIYGAFVLAAIITIVCLLAPLKDWLIRYEASQPETMCQNVFDQYFAQPDWGVLYDAAQIQDTAFEGKDAYVAYMTRKYADAADSTLSYMETSAGLSGDHKYIIKLDEEKIASFTLVESSSTQSNATVWELGSIELFFERTQSVTVEKLSGYTVFVNGVALDDSYTIRTVSTKAEDYLPEGVHGYQSQQQYVGQLLAAPEITVQDENGNAVEMTADGETGVLKPQLPDREPISQEDSDTVKEAARNYALFAIRKIGSGTLRKYMDPTSQIFKDVINTPAFLQAFTGYKIHDDIQINDYYRYSDTLFSARVSLQMDVYATRGNTKVFQMDTTFFFTQNSNGKFWITDSTNVDTSQLVEQVRLTFMNGSELVDSFMVDANAATITLPQVTAPQGQVLKGWAVQTVDENGNINMTILYTPDENGAAAASSPEPATLYAVFEVGA